MYATRRPTSDLCGGPERVTLVNGNAVPHDSLFVDRNAHGYSVQHHGGEARSEMTLLCGLTQGPFVWRFPNGISLDGTYVDGKRQGRFVQTFVQTFASGSIIEGTFVDDKMQGRFVSTCANGTITEGTFGDNN